MKVKLTKEQLLSLDIKRIKDYITNNNQHLYTVNIMSKHETYTGKQNAFYWQMVEIIRNKLGYAKPEMHKYLKDTFLGIDIDIDKLDKRDFSSYIEKVKALMFELGCGTEEDIKEEIYGNY